VSSVYCKAPGSGPRSGPTSVRQKGGLPGTPPPRSPSSRIPRGHSLRITMRIYIRCFNAHPLWPPGWRVEACIKHHVPDEWHSSKYDVSDEADTSHAQVAHCASSRIAYLEPLARNSIPWTSCTQVPLVLSALCLFLVLLRAHMLALSLLSLALPQMSGSALVDPAPSPAPRPARGQGVGKAGQR
jgi:hypothetical protein